ncbi:alpha/beta hydrolase-fold protein [Bizionia myxarmorum]|uniref:Alpha/beta hydrolase n=1 Tax=Bizionia myxarmorum TaxID=291186 RepID=A0A5D0R874_9FLAO|nr:alpha/beta hydrolase-fold protein [Bizionia myxarmorum]TYB77125.1 alpha/beta hydrolase [Bizionia myxarmorum]
MILLISMLFIAVCHETSAQTNNKGLITIGVSDSIQSSILDEKRDFWVHIPESENDSEVAFPVVYLLDGDKHFTSVVGIIQELSATKGNTLMPKMIVVGILNTDRMRDLTPKHGNQKNGPNTSGGGEAFLDFMKKELIPYIDQKYPTKPYRIYIGHSLGGLTVINTMLKKPELFNSYIALDPSLWWADSAMLKEANVILNNKSLTDETLYLGIANTLKPEVTIGTVTADTTHATQHIRDILEFSTKIVPESSAKLDFKFQYYPDDGHGSLPLIATYDALRYIFSWYDMDKSFIPLILNLEIKDVAVIKTLKIHFQNISEKLGYTVLPPEDYVNQLGYGCIKRELYEKAEAFFKLNVKNYPNNSNVYDSLGDYYAAIKDIDKAILAYHKALKTGAGSTYSRDKLYALLLQEKAHTLVLKKNH